jgi:hypothetical protein
MLSARSLTRSCGTHSSAVFHCPRQLWSSHAHPESRAERLTLFEQEERISCSSYEPHEQQLIALTREFYL